MDTKQQKAGLLNLVLVLLVSSLVLKSFYHDGLFGHGTAINLAIQVAANISGAVGMTLFLPVWFGVWVEKLAPGKMKTPRDGADRFTNQGDDTARESRI